MRLLGNTRHYRFGPRDVARKFPAARAALAGFTLIELMVTLAIAVILVVLAVPSFRSIIAANKLTTAANDLVATINVARVEAVRRNSETQVCSNSGDLNNNGGGNADNLANACTNGGNLTGEIYGFVDATNTNRIQAAPPGLFSGSISLVGNTAAVRFGSDGIGRAVGNTSPLTADVAIICTSEVDTDNRRRVTLTAGSIVSVSKATGACQ